MQIYNVKRVKYIALSIFTFLMAFFFTACSSSSSMNITCCSGALDSEQMITSLWTLTEQTNGLPSSEQTLSISSIIMGSGETQDAKLQDSIGQNQFAAMITAREIDIILCTLDKDDILAKSDSFMPLEKIFSTEELTELVDLLIAHETDATPYGVILTDTETLTPVFGDVPIGIFLADNCPNPSLAKEFMRNLVLP